MARFFFKGLRNASVDAGARRVEQHEIRWKSSRQSVFDVRSNCARRLPEPAHRPRGGISVELDCSDPDSKVAQGYCGVTSAGVCVDCIAWFVSSRPIDDVAVQNFRHLAIDLGERCTWGAILTPVDNAASRLIVGRFPPNR